MNYRYSRNRQKIYMILEGRPSEEGYEDRMLQSQQLSCLLPFHLVDQNEQRQVWYDISGKRALKEDWICLVCEGFFSDWHRPMENWTAI